MNNIESLSKQPYKGTADIYPLDMQVREYLFGTWKKVAKKFGYEEYDAPLIEEAKLYKVKSGEELANNQLYSFTDKGGREIALRPELTPSLARMVAQKKNELTYPLRWFNIGRFYRYEKPQRGRTREFFQLNIDILGVDSINAEIELLQFILTVMGELNAPKETYEIRLSSRALLDYLFDKILKVNEEIRGELSRAIDNYLKMEKSTFLDYIKDIGLDKKQADDLIDFLQWDIEKVKEIEDKDKGIKDLIELFEQIKKLGLSNIKFCPYIVRGLQYYTGMVFEMYDIGSQENPRSLFGGGRYDTLLEIFNEEQLPAFGLGWGDVPTIDYLSTYNLIPEQNVDIDVFLVLMDASASADVFSLAKRFRENGIKTRMQLTPSKLSKQLKYVAKLNIPWVAILGEEEIKNNTVTLKNMSKQEQYELTVEEAIERIK